MTTLNALIDGVEATMAITPIDTPALLTPLSPSFIGTDAITPPPGGFSAVYAFGDSLSDAGNVAFATLGVVPQAPYSDGRFTNGDVWVQDLARNLGLPAVKPSLEGGTDYAYGGALTGTTPVHTANPTDLPSQLAQFEANVPHPAANALYTVWAGSNDVLDIANATETAAQQVASVQQAAGNEAAVISGLIAHGAKDLVVMDVPDLGKTPYETARPLTAAASSVLAQDFNTDLGAAIRQIMATSGASIDTINTYGLLDAAIADPSAYGLTNVTEPLWNGTLTSSTSGTLAATGAAQSGYLFFDSLHPTATGHALLASAVTQTLTGTA